jgi:hypothetical protein
MVPLVHCDVKCESHEVDQCAKFAHVRIEEIRHRDGLVAGNFNVLRDGDEKRLLHFIAAHAN